MQTASNINVKKSCIHILFGHKINTEQVPLVMNFSFDIFSKRVHLHQTKNENIRFNLQQMLNLVIQDNSIVIQLIAKSGYGSQLASKITKFFKSSETYQKRIQTQKLCIKSVGKADKCYITISSQKIKQVFQDMSKPLQGMNHQDSEQKQSQNHSIELKINSQNNCQQIAKMLSSQGLMRAAFDSLSLTIIFQKTKLIQKLLEKVFTQNKAPELVGPLKSFKNLNLSVNFSSSSQFERYQKMRILKSGQQKIQTKLFSILRNQFSDEVKVYIFNEKLSFSGKIYGQKFETLLQAMFQDPDQKQ